MWDESELRSLIRSSKAQTTPFLGRSKLMMVWTTSAIQGLGFEGLLGFFWVISEKIQVKVTGAQVSRKIGNEQSMEEMNHTNAPNPKMSGV
ncbi:hypothetical protein H5410_064125 [Solanum commersonii]|uniref:Uncharacterized protein n=1 Tax=Solanum commersonii TaxID=4109 RepID=A0A9J5W0E9_SOLCO|nr:hypothetical protein H5410_064125 [Solanum commersonii]